MKAWLKGFIVLTLTLVTAGSAVYAGINDGLVGYYPFNGNSNDESGNGNNGIVHDAIFTLDRFGSMESAVSFNGTNSRISIPTSPTLNIAGSVSIEAWFVSHSDNGGIIVGKENPVILPRSGYVLVNNANGSISVHCFDNNGDRVYVNTLSFGDNYNYNDGIYHHVVGVCDINGDGRARLYVDGELKGVSVASNGSAPWRTLESISNIGTNDYSVIIGDRDGSPFPLWGVIDRVAIYNQALSQLEIQKLYNEGKKACNCTDADSDGVPDAWDQCPNTPAGSCTNNHGCLCEGLYTEEQMNQMVEAILTWGDTNNDGKIGLTEAIHALRITSGVTQP